MKTSNQVGELKTTRSRTGDNLHLFLYLDKTRLFVFATLPQATWCSDTKACTHTWQMPRTAKDANALVVHRPGLLPGRAMTSPSHQLIKGKGHTQHTCTFILIHHKKRITFLPKCSQHVLIIQCNSLTLISLLSVFDDLFCIWYLIWC